MIIQLTAKYTVLLGTNQNPFHPKKTTNKVKKVRKEMQAVFSKVAEERGLYYSPAFFGYDFSDASTGEINLTASEFFLSDNPLTVAERIELKQAFKDATVSFQEHISTAGDVEEKTYDYEPRDFKALDNIIDDQMDLYFPMGLFKDMCLNEFSGPENDLIIPSSETRYIAVACQLMILPAEEDDEDEPDDEYSPSPSGTFDEFGNAFAVDMLTEEEDEYAGYNDDLSPEEEMLYDSIAADEIFEETIRGFIANSGGMKFYRGTSIVHADKESQVTLTERVDIIRHPSGIPLKTAEELIKATYRNAAIVLDDMYIEMLSFEITNATAKPISSRKYLAQLTTINGLLKKHSPYEPFKEIPKLPSDKENNIFGIAIFRENSGELSRDDLGHGLPSAFGNLISEVLYHANKDISLPPEACYFSLGDVQSYLQTKGKISDPLVAIGIARLEYPKDVEDSKAKDVTKAILKKAADSLIKENNGLELLSLSAIFTGDDMEKEIGTLLSDAKIRKD